MKILKGAAAWQRIESSRIRTMGSEREWARALSSKLDLDALMSANRWGGAGKTAKRADAWAISKPLDALMNKRAMSLQSLSSSGICLSEEVEEALHSGKPVVALESTIISHGMPFPQNLETARAVEAIVRAGGAVPATICVLSGVAHVGTKDIDLARLAELGLKVRKTATRDLPLLMSGLCGGDGATTVSATMWLAHRAGIQVFVTGGIGGVHRGVQATGDVSADLTELSRTPVAVVCAGAKSILDIPRTLEFLETHSVPVVGFGSNTFPAFFSPDSGSAAQVRLDSAEDVAKLLHARRRLGLQSGTVIGVPIPTHAASHGQEVEEAITQALLEARSSPHVSGAAVTPFLLKRVNELTAGASLKANIALVKNNAAVGAAIASSLAILDSLAIPHSSSLSSASPSPFPSPAPFASSCPSGARASASDIGVTGAGFAWFQGHLAGEEAGGRKQAGGAAAGEKSAGKAGWSAAGRGGKAVVVVGGACVDTQGVCIAAMVAASSNPGMIRSAFGGVGRNIAESIARLGHLVHLHSVVGDDEAGRAIRAHCASVPNLDASGIRVINGVTSAQYLSLINHEGDLVAAIADMAIFSYLTPESVGDEMIAAAAIVVVDGNLPIFTLRHICQTARKLKVPVFFEPTSVPKATAAAEEGVMSYVTFTSPNEAELAAMAAAVRRRKGTADRERERETDTGREELISIQEHLLKEAEELHSEARGAEGDREEVRAEGEGMSAGRGQKLERIRRDITVLLDVGVEVVLVTAGSEGIYYGTIDIETGAPAVVHFPANVVPPHAIANTTGAGDSFAGGFVCAASRQWPLDQAVALGQAAASLALYSHAPVSAELCMEALAQPVLLSMRPPPALKPRGETHVFTQGDKAGVERESDRRPF